jgi:chaperonin cofactor prefoldin
VDEMRVVVTDGFISLDGRLRTLERRVEMFETRVTGQVAALSAQSTALKSGLERLDRRLTRLERQGLETRTRLDGLHADMRQRFRLLNDRVAAVENRLAA